MARAGGPRLAVVGGGWAGMAAARALARRGAHVVLLERRGFLGGRAFSFRDRASGLVLDNGQHVLLGCCRAFRGLLASLDLDDAVRFQPRLRVPVWKAGRQAVLGASGLPGALHLLPGMLAYGHLRPEQRWRAAGAAFAMWRPGGAGSEETFAAWLQRHGQGADEVAALWDLIGVAVLNGRAADVGAREAIAALRRGFMSGPAASALGFFRRPLGEVAARMGEHLHALGVEVRQGWTVRSLEPRPGGGWRLTAVAGGRERCLCPDGVVAAIPPDALASVWGGGEAGRLRERARYSPIVNVYLRYDRPVMRGEVDAFAGGRLQILLNRGRLEGDADLDGRLLALSLSAADELLGMGSQDLVAALREELGRALPAAAGARLEWAKVVWQRQATLLPTPAARSLHALAAAGRPGLTLAGDWTVGDWPASLEAAVRSGVRAAEALWRQWVGPAAGGAAGE